MANSSAPRKTTGTIEQEAAASEIAIHLVPTIPDAITPCRDCRHEPGLQITVNQRLEPAPRGRSRIALDAIFCLACGSFHHNSAFDSWEDALAALWKEIGWDIRIGERIHRLLDERIPDRAYQYYALIHGLSPAEVDASLAAAAEA